MKKIDWNNVNEAEEFPRLAVGGYICRITSAVDTPQKEYLKIEYDIADGEFKDYFKNSSAAIGFWNGNFIRSYKEKAQSFFKSFLTAIKRSNQNFIFDDNESNLVGKMIGLVIGEEEYQKNDGSVGKRYYIDKTRSVSEIRDKNFKMPELKKSKASSNYSAPQTAPPNDGFYPVDDSIDDSSLPF